MTTPSPRPTAMEPATAQLRGVFCGFVPVLRQLPTPASRAEKLSAWMPRKSDWKSTATPRRIGQLEQRLALGRGGDLAALQGEEPSGRRTAMP